MDIPTTDPGIDFLEYYTTEDECETDFENDGNMVKTSITRISKILHNDIRKSSSISYDHQLSIMPPELIITKVFVNLPIHVPINQLQFIFLGYRR